MFNNKYVYYCLLKPTNLSGICILRFPHIILATPRLDVRVRLFSPCSLVLHDATFASRHPRSPLFTACLRYTSVIINIFTAFFVRDFYHVQLYPTRLSSFSNQSSHKLLNTNSMVSLGSHEHKPWLNKQQVFFLVLHYIILRLYGEKLSL